MKKLFIRLFVAFAAFNLGLVLTNFRKPKFEYDHVVSVRVQPRLTNLESTEDRAQIMQIYREYGPAQTRHDRSFFHRVETEDFTLTVGDVKMSREEDIKWMEEQPADIVYETRVDHLRVFEHLAVAHGYLEIRDGSGEVEEWPFADVWVKRGGAWRIQSTTSQ
jgi:hypothetical protein